MYTLSRAMMYTLSRVMLVPLVLLGALGCEKSPQLHPLPTAQDLSEATDPRADVGQATPDLAVPADLLSAQDLRCIPNCIDKDCGDDGCGGSCGTCVSPKRCNDKNKCICVPNCTGAQCGSDGCGGSCGMCRADEFCDEFPGNFISCGNCYPGTDDLDKFCRCRCKCSGGAEVFGTCIYAMMSCGGCRQYCENYCTSRIPRQTMVSRCGTCTGG